MVVSPAVQPVKVRNALAIGADNLRIHNGAHVEPGRVLHNQGVAVRPVMAPHREQAHSTVPYMDLQSIAVMLELVHPGRTLGRALGDNRPARMNVPEGGALTGRPRGLRDMRTI
jgi:hypothetical protein